MKRTIKSIILLILAVLLVACSVESQNEDTQSETSVTNSDDLNIGVVLMTLSSEYWKIHKAGAEKAAEEFGVNVDILGPEEETQYEQQVKMVEDLISSNVDALVVAPSLPEAMLPALIKANETDIPVVLVDANVEDFEDRITFIGTENYQAAFQAGEHIKDQLEDGDKVLLIRGQMGAKVHDERTQGFEDALEGLDIEFIVHDAQSDRMEAVNITEDVLMANEDIKLIFATSDEMALGTSTGLENIGRTDVPLIGFDGTPDGLKAVLEGKMIANVAQDPYEMGYLGIESAIKAIKGEEVEERIDSGSDVFTSDNVESRINELEEILK